MSNEKIRNTLSEHDELLSPSGHLLYIPDAVGAITLEAAVRFMHEAYQARFDLPDDVDTSERIEYALVVNKFYLLRVLAQDFQVGEKIKIHVYRGNGEFLEQEGVVSEYVPPVLTDSET